MTIKKAPKILIVTPEVTYLPDRMGSLSDCLTAKAGGLADVSASLICELFRQGADVHAAIPNYKTIFGDCLTSYLQKEQTSMRRVLPKDRLHLASSMPRIRPLIHPPILTSFAITDLAIMQRQNERIRSHYKKKWV